MHAAATLPEINPLPLDATLPEPILFLDGLPHPTAVALEFSATGPLDRREALLQITPTAMAPDDPAVASIAPTPQAYPTPHAANHAVLARPIRLLGQAQRFQVLAAGRIVASDERLAAHQTQHNFQLQDRFAQALDQPPANESQPAIAEAEALDTALHALADAAGFQLEPLALPPAKLSQRLDSTRSLADLFLPLLHAHQLQLRLVRQFIAGRLTEQLRVQPQRLAPKHRLRGDHPALIARRHQPGRPPAIRVIAEGPARRKESTFTLHPGYDTALQSEPDSAYQPDTSPDWPTYAPVLRRWLLNEDAVSDDLPVFDLATFFNDPAISPTATPFRDCLTLDAAGNPLPPLLETSYDAGNTFTLSTLRFSIDPNRAAITLTDPVLPTPLLTAARNDQLRLRLTASLTAPKPTRLTRFRGNLFLNPPTPRTTRYPDLRFDTLHTDSIHADRVALDQLQADTRDDSAELRRRLITLLTDSPPHHEASQTRLTLNDTTHAHLPGDQIELDQQPFTLLETRIRFGQARTELLLTQA